MSYPGYIGDIPLDFQQRDDFMGSANFIDFAVAQGWFDAGSGDAFNVTKIYGATQQNNTKQLNTAF